MIEFLIDNIGNIVSMLIVGAIVFFAVWSLVKDRKAGKSPCGGNCAHCGGCCKCARPAQTLTPPSRRQVK